MRSFCTSSSRISLIQSHNREYCSLKLTTIRFVYLRANLQKICDLAATRKLQGQREAVAVFQLERSVQLVAERFYQLETHGSIGFEVEVIGQASSIVRYR